MIFIFCRYNSVIKKKKNSEKKSTVFWELSAEQMKIGFANPMKNAVCSFAIFTCFIAFYTYECIKKKKKRKKKLYVFFFFFFSFKP